MRSGVVVACDGDPVAGRRFSGGLVDIAALWRALLSPAL
jgi:hypothetical protein